MSEMIERVARVLEPQAWRALGAGDTLAYKNRRISSLRKARAAIEAMMEPTLDMIVGGMEPWSKSDDAEVVAEIWQAMLSAALHGDQEG